MICAGTLSGIAVAYKRAEALSCFDCKVRPKSLSAAAMASQLPIAVHGCVAHPSYAALGRLFHIKACTLPAGRVAMSRTTWPRASSMGLQSCWGRMSQTGPSAREASMVHLPTTVVRLLQAWSQAVLWACRWMYKANPELEKQQRPSLYGNGYSYCCMLEVGAEQFWAMSLCSACSTLQRWARHRQGHNSACWGRARPCGTTPIAHCCLGNCSCAFLLRFCEAASAVQANLQLWPSAGPLSKL